MERLIKGPSFIVFIGLFEGKILLSINEKVDFFGGPVDGVGVEFRSEIRNHLLSSFLSPDRMIESLRMHRAMDIARIIAYVLHDINLPVLGPASKAAFLWQHPDRRPGTHALGKFCSYFNVPILPEGLA